MKIANMDLNAFPFLPGTHPDGARVQLKLAIGPFFEKAIEVTPDQARELGAQMLQAANLSEGKNAEATD